LCALHFPSFQHPNFVKLPPKKLDIINSKFLWAVPMRKSKAALAICLLVQGCALVQNQQAIDATSALIGRRRAEIMACAGIPDQVTIADGKEIATYIVVGLARHLVSGTVLGQGQCTTTIVFDAGRVSAVNYESEDPGILAPLESCAQIVAGCLR
jgi:hypothetical protein